VQQAPDLLSAVVEAFTRVTERALLPGLVQGYRQYEAALPVVRGRIREADQIRRGYSVMVPVEVRYDDFTVDTPENRLLRAALIRALRLPGLPRPLRHRLLRLDVRLADVTAVRTPGLLEPLRPTRLVCTTRCDWPRRSSPRRRSSWAGLVRPSTDSSSTWPRCSRTSCAPLSAPSCAPSPAPLGPRTGGTSMSTAG
jgi:hypothetical protein